jgi:hypothetical protein
VILGSITASFAHGLLIIAAPESVDAHHSWDAATEAVHGGPDSIYASVQQAATGLVTIECRNGGDFESDLLRLYSGDLQLPSMKVLIYDPDRTMLLTVLTNSKSVRVDLYGNHEDESSKVVLHIIESQNDAAPAD